MSYVSNDRNYTDNTQSGVDAKAERVGDITGEPATNEPVNRDKSAKMANLLEGLEFPATKEDIKNHINSKSPTMGNRNNDVLEAIQNNLEDGVKYNNVYDVELAARLVEKKRINNYFNQETNFQYFNFQSTHTKEFSVCICIILLF